jgi:RNA-binding protein
MEDIIKLRAKAKLLEPLIRIGKNGLTEGAVNEIKQMLMKRRMIKIKMLEAFYSGKDKKELANEIAEKTNSVLVESVGNVAVLHKK